MAHGIVADVFRCHTVGYGFDGVKPFNRHVVLAQELFLFRPQFFTGFNHADAFNTVFQIREACDCLLSKPLAHMSALDGLNCATYPQHIIH